MEQTKSTTCLPPQSFDFVEEDLLCCSSLYEVEDEIDQEPVDLDDNDQVETAKMENQVVVKLNLYFSFATKWHTVPFIGVWCWEGLPSEGP